MAGCRRYPTLFRTAIRTGSMVAVTAAAGLGVILAGGAGQAATISPAALAAASHAATSRHWQHVAHVAHAARYRRPAHLAAYRGASVGGNFQACVIGRESGGNPRAVNPSGAGGLYQFTPSTWRSLGYSGRPQDAPVWEQTQAFQRLYGQQGRQPWSSDGC